MVEEVYKYVNGISTKEQLISYLEKTDTIKYSNLISKLKNNIDNTKIINIIVHSKEYLKEARKMKILDLMILVTNYCPLGMVPNVSQHVFNKMVKAANRCNDKKEIRLVNLAVNYTHTDIKYKYLEKVIINNKDTKLLKYYMEKNQRDINYNSIVKEIIKTKDQKFIESVKNDDVLITKIPKELLLIMK